MRNEIALYLSIYLVLQVMSLILLPKWWKAAACPSLIVAVVALLDLTDGGNLSGFITLWVTPYGIGWLVLVPLAFAVATAIREKAPVDGPTNGEGGAPGD